MGKVAGDSVSLSETAAYNFADKNAGTGKTVSESGLALTGNDANNYTLNVAPTGTANITPATIAQSFYASSKAYNGNTSTTGYLGPRTGVIIGDQVSVDASGASYNFADKNAGNAKSVTASGMVLAGEDSSNYVLQTPTTTSNIYPALIELGGSANSKVYDGTTAATGTVNIAGGLVGSDQVSLGSYSLAFSNKNAGSNKRVNWTGTLLGTDSGNYVVDTEESPFSANIAKASLTDLFTANNKVYDGTTAASVTLGAMMGKVAGDSVSLSGTGAYSFADKNAGIGKSVSEVGLSLVGSDAANYTLNVAPTGTADISPATIAQLFTAANKVYDGSTKAPGTLESLSGIIEGDTVAISGTAAYNFSNKNAGTGKTVSGSGLNLTGADAGNYILAMVPTGTAEITPAHLTETFTAKNKVYDGTTTATVTTGNLSGEVSGDSVSLGGTAVYSFADKNAGSEKTVSGSGLVLSGPDASNYTLSLVQNGSADITPAQLLYTASTTGGSRPYGAANPAFSGNVTGLVGGDTLVSVTSGSPVFTSSATAASNVGTYPVMGSGLTLNNANYTLAQAPGNATAFAVNPITISIGSVSRNTGQPNPTFTVSYSGPNSDYIKSLLANLKLVTNAPASDAPGAYQITAILPDSFANSLIVQSGTLTINNGMAEQQSAFPASLDTQTVIPPAPLAAPSSMGSGLLPSTAGGVFQIAITPSQSWSVGYQAGPITGDALSHASFTETSPDGTTTDHQSTYAAGAHK